MLEHFSKFAPCIVAPNSVEQQDLQNIHRVRARLVKQRVMLCNQARGLLLEYGIIVRQGVNYLTQALARIVEEAPDSSRVLWKELFAELREELNALNVEIYQYDKRLKRISKQHPVCARLEQILGTTATAIVAAVGNPHDFKNGRQFSAWLGLVPQQHSTGGKTVLRGISKRGDKYIRKLLVHGARCEVRLARRHHNTWVIALERRRGFNKAAVALANKNARRIWARKKRILPLEAEYVTCAFSLIGVSYGDNLTGRGHM